MILMWALGQVWGWPQTVAYAATIDPIQALLNYGLAGIVIFLLVTGQLRTKAEVAALERTVEKQAEIITALQQSLTGNALPAMSASLEAVEAVPRSGSRALAQVANTQQDMAELVRRLEALVAERANDHEDAGP